MTDKILPFGITVGGKDSLVGTYISINLKRGSFFIVGDTNLSAENYFIKVPEGQPAEYYDTLRLGLSHGYIVTGKKRIRLIEKTKGILSNWQELINKEGKSAISVKAFRKLIQAKMDGGYSLKEIVDFCIKMETHGKNRPSVREFLENVLAYCEEDSRYDSRVFDDPDDTTEIKIRTA